MKRRILLTAGATLPVALGWRKPLAAPAPLVPRLDEAQPPGSPVPVIYFNTEDGTSRTLKDYAGQGIVLNFWATWCMPCVSEMPALAKLAASLRGTKVVVLPLSSDRGGAAVVQRYFQEKEIAGLPVLLDPRGDAARAMGTRGIPTTVLIDAAGRERGRLEGAADWASPEAVAAVRELAK